MRFNGDSSYLLLFLGHPVYRISNKAKLLANTLKTRAYRLEPEEGSKLICVSVQCPALVLTTDGQHSS